MSDWSDERVITYANGYGIWHARIEFPAPGYGPAYLEASSDRIRAKARRAIRREVALREEVSRTWICRLEISDNDLDPQNVMRSITYRERTL